MKNDLIFLIILVIVVGYIFILYKVETMADIGNIEQIKEAVKQVYAADVEAIRNLSNVATQLQAAGLTVPGNLAVKGLFNIHSGDNNSPIVAQSNTDTHIQLKTKNDDMKTTYLINRDGHFRVHQHGVGDMFGVNHDGHTYVRHTGDHVINIDGDGNNPYISLGKTGTWDKKKLYIQNVDAHTDNPLFRVGIHGTGLLMDMNKSHGVRWSRKDGRMTHFDWEDGKNYIRGETIQDGNLNVNGGDVLIKGRNVLAELNDLHTNAVRKDKKYAILADTGGHLTDKGGWAKTTSNPNEKMRFIEL